MEVRTLSTEADYKAYLLLRARAWGGPRQSLHVDAYDRFAQFIALFDSRGQIALTLRMVAPGVLNPSLPQLVAAANALDASRTAPLFQQTPARISAEETFPISGYLDAWEAAGIRYVEFGRIISNSNHGIPDAISRVMRFGMELAASCGYRHAIAGFPPERTKAWSRFSLIPIEGIEPMVERYTGLKAVIASAAWAGGREF
jgi:hypothetical protein